MKHNVSTPAGLLMFVALVTVLVALFQPSTKIHASPDTSVFLPMVVNLGGSGGTPEQIALERINFYRGLADVPLVQLHPALVTAARNHASYDILNYGDNSAWVYGPHGEVAGKPGYTGQMPGDRADAAGYPFAGGWEVMSHLDDPMRSIDSLMGTILHRIIILVPTHQYVGYGKARGTNEVVDVIDFGKGTSDPTGQVGVVIFPADGQTNVPLQGTGEMPNPLPPGASYPIGYPITIQPVNGTALTVSQAELRDGNGALVSVHPNPSQCGATCYAIIPTTGLTVSTTYTVHVAGAVDGVSFDKTWTFTTTPCRFTGFC